MARIGVDYGSSQNLFGSGQSLGAALAGAIGGGGELKRELISSQLEKNQAYTRATLAKAGLDEQEMGGRNDLSKAAADLARYRAGQGSSNAQHAGAAPAPVDPVDAQARFIGAGQLLSKNATDSAQGFNKGMGGVGMMFGAPADARTNLALTGVNPTDHTVLGPMDRAGTQSQIDVGNAREAAKAQGDIAVNAANVPNKIAIEQADVPNKIAIDTAKQQTELQLDPMKNPDSRLVQLEAKAQREGLTPDEEAQRQFIRRSKYGKPDIQFEDKGTGQHVVMPAPGDKIGNLYPSREPPPPTAAPAVVDPMAPKVPAGPPSPMAAAPAPVGQPGDLPGTMRFGSPKPTAAPTESQAKEYNYTRAKILAESTLQNYTQSSQIPTQMAAAVRAAQNSGMTAQQFWESLPSEGDRAFFDAAYLFLIGTLREESGAAIGMNEFAQRYPTLLPGAHASPDEIARKTYARKSNIAGAYYGLPLHLQRAVEAFGQKNGVPVRDEEVPYVAPYSPAAPQQAPAGPKPGEVMDGHRFLGGDPADQNAWELVQ